MSSHVLDTGDKSSKWRGCDFFPRAFFLFLLHNTTQYYLWYLKCYSQVLWLDQCGLRTFLLKVHCQSNPSFNLFQVLHFSQLSIKVRCTDQSMTNHCAAITRHYEITLNTMCSLLIYLPWLCDWACDDADFSIIFVPQSLKHFAIRQNT